jgi:dolichol-phosphate mannosyltransferase
VLSNLSETRIDTKETRWRVLERYIRFSMVGLSGVAFDTAVLHLCASSSGLGWNVSVAKTLAAEAAILNNFYWNDIWTFRPVTHVAGGREKRLLRLGKFNLVCAAGILVNLVLLNVQVRLLGVNLYVANLISIGLVSVLNFYVCSRTAWKKGCGSGRVEIAANPATPADARCSIGRRAS